MRPFVFTVEVFFLGLDGVLLPFIYPLALGLLLFSSFPVHRRFYSEGVGCSSYVKAVCAITLAGYLVSLVIGVLLDKAFLFGVCIGLVFCIEKISDEVQRYCELKKWWRAWLLWATARYGWPMIAFSLEYFLALTHLDSIVLVAGLSVLLMITVCYLLSSSLGDLESFEGDRAIGLFKDSIQYVPINLNSTILRQISRYVLLAKYPLMAYPISMAYQCAAPTAIAANVIFFVRYKRIIAVKPRLFLQRVQTPLQRIVNIFGLCTVIFWLFTAWLDLSHGWLALIFVETVLVSLLASLCSTLMWLSSYKQYQIVWVALISALSVTLASFTSSINEFIAVLCVGAYLVFYLVGYYAFRK